MVESKMVRVAISVAGLTEEKFVKQTLAPYLQNKNISITPISLGGNISVNRITANVNKLLPNFDLVTTLYDFYGFKRKDENETKISLEEKIKQSVHEESRHRFIPYIQMYEFEALLFSSPQHIANEFNDNQLEIWANEILTKFENKPEKINDSKETAPSKRLADKISYKKSVNSPNIAKNIGLNNIRQKCTGFDQWIHDIEQLVSTHYRQVN